MKKIEFYYILIISAIISVFSLGMLKEAFTTNLAVASFSIVYVSLLFVFSGVLIHNLKKIKFNIDNLYFLDKKYYINIATIGLFLLSMFFVLKQIVVIVKYSGGKFSVSPILYIVLVFLSLYLFLLFKLFIAIKKEKESKGVTKQYFDIKEVNLQDYYSLGKLPKETEHTSFIEKQEFNIDKKTYNNYKPILHSKKYNNTGDFILNYTNKEDLIFNVVIEKNTTVFIKFNTRTKSKELIGEEVFKTISEL